MLEEKMTPEKIRKMNIAHCNICMLCKNHCQECPLSWALVFKSGEYMNWLAIEAIKTDEVLLNLESAVNFGKLV